MTAKTAKTAQQVHETLKGDRAYSWSRQRRDAFNMMIVLRAHGFNYTATHAEVMINLVPEGA